MRRVNVDRDRDDATMSTGFERKYSDAQRDAVTDAYEDRHVRPASRVVRLAAAGELEHAGGKVPPFAITENMVRELASKLRKRRRGELTSQLAHAAPRDAIETLRRRLVSAADTMLADFERQLQRDAGATDPERLRQITRAVREAAALPGPGDERPKAPGAKTDGKRTGGETQGGLAGSILKDARSGDEQPAQSVYTQASEHGDNGTGNAGADGEHGGAAQRVNAADQQQDDGSPGAVVRRLAVLEAP